MKDNSDHQGNIEFTTNLSYYTNLAKTWLAFTIIAGAILLIILILIIFLRNRIRIAIALIKASSRFLFWSIHKIFNNLPKFYDNSELLEV